MSEENKLTRQELLERFAAIQGISYEEAELQVGAPTEEEILKNIEDKTIEKIRAAQVPLNRKQRRALQKKLGAKKYSEIGATPANMIEEVNETAKKLSYIDLIQKLRKLNEKKEKENEENGKTTTENDGCVAY